MSIATNPLSQGINDDVETTAAPSRPADSWRRPPPPHAAPANGEEADFDFHDTIPAPPWLGESELDEEPTLPAR